MPLSKNEWLALEKKAFDLRKLTVQTTVWAGSGHFGGGMSVMDLLTVLYHKYLNIRRNCSTGEDAGYPRQDGKTPWSFTAA